MKASPIPSCISLELLDPEPKKPGSGYGTLSEGAGAEGDKLLAEQARIARNDIYGASLEQTNVKQESYNRDVVQPFQEGLYQQKGGAEGVEAARKGVIDQAAKDVAPFQEASEQASKAVETGTADFKTLIETDPVFGADVTELGKRTNVNIYEGTNQLETDITKKVMQAEKFMSDERKKLYERIPDTVKVQSKSFQPLVYKTDENGMLTDELADFLETEFLKNICNDYKMILQRHYSYLISNDAISETIISNEYEFTENGNPFNIN